jgi:hypothetical protein
MNSKISGIQIPNSDKEAPIFQHADDTTLTVSNKKSVGEIFKVFEKYEASSGAKTNRTSLSCTIFNANEPVFST